MKVVYKRIISFVFGRRQARAKAISLRMRFFALSSHFPFVVRLYNCTQMLKIIKKSLFVGAKQFIGAKKCGRQERRTQEYTNIASEHFAVYRRIFAPKTLCILALVCLLVVGAAINVAPISVKAESEENFSKTNVLEDLRSADEFDIKNYPYDESKNAQIINFVEYCYSYKANMRDNYGLYVYVYNPKGLSITVTSNKNKIQMATSYNSGGIPNAYDKFDLELCNKSEESNYKNLFYKYKVVDRSINNTKFSDRVNSNERRYDISGIELLTYGEANATEYAVNGTYLFTGFSKGYGPTANVDSTLHSEVKYLETVELDVKHTFYRTKTSSKGAGYQNQLDTVYFAVPNKFFNTYGTLQRIKAEWYEYKTKDIVVTSNQDFYDKANSYIGIQTGELDKFGMTVYNKDIGISLGQDAGDYGGGMYGAKWGWNLGSGYLHVPCSTLYYLFKVGSISEYDPYADIVSIGGVESNALYEYIKKYDKTYTNGTLHISDGKISADLFEKDIDDYRKTDTEYGKIQNGYSYYDFDADVDLQKLSSWNEGNPSFWDNWMNFGLWNAMTGVIPDETSRTVSPIYNLKDNDLSGSNAEISDRLMVNANNVSDIKSFYETSKNNDCSVVLFRFATSDYYSAAVDIIELGAGFMWSDKHTSGQAYRAFESVFLNFDIISLSFQKEGIYTVIPAVSNPIDIINGITLPVIISENISWWQWLIGLIMLVIILIVLIPILPWIVQFVFWIVKLPFKAVGAIVKRIMGGKRK